MPSQPVAVTCVSDGVSFGIASGAAHGTPSPCLGTAGTRRTPSPCVGTAGTRRTPGGAFRSRRRCFAQAPVHTVAGVFSRRLVAGMIPLQLRSIRPRAHVSAWDQPTSLEANADPWELDRAATRPLSACRARPLHCPATVPSESCRFTRRLCLTSALQTRSLRWGALRHQLGTVLAATVGLGLPRKAGGLGFHVSLLRWGS